MEAPTFKCVTPFYSVDGFTEYGTVISQREYWRLSLIERGFFKVERTHEIYE
jgi:hypothetical protein